jgi:hypothetical protein
MEKHESYLGIKPFGVLIDDSPELAGLVRQARKLKSESFDNRLLGVKQLALDAMVNAYEESKINPDPEEAERHRKTVFESHTLSEALQGKSGCCRYQGALFFALAYEADLGDIHFIQQAPVHPDNILRGLRSVFNDIVHEGELRHVSIFKDSLRNPEFDYSRQNPQVFDSAIGFSRPENNSSPRTDPWKMTHYSYHRTDSGLVICSEQSRHVESPV